jgi:hypothetical protein
VLHPAVAWTLVDVIGGGRHPPHIGYSHQLDLQLYVTGSEYFRLQSQVDLGVHRHPAQELPVSRARNLIDRPSGPPYYDWNWAAIRQMIWARNPLLIRHVLRDHATSPITRTRGCFAFATVSLITSHRSTRHADEGGEWLIQGNYKDRKWDYLVEGVILTDMHCCSSSVITTTLP